MAKESLLTHRKFAHLCAMLRIPRPHALGYLELLYLTAHAAACPDFGNADILEACADWSGKRGALVKALLEARLIDKGRGGVLTLHDYWDHAPNYVGQRFERKAAAARAGAERCRTVPNGAERVTPRSDPDPDRKTDQDRSRSRDANARTVPSVQSSEDRTSAEETAMNDKAGKSNCSGNGPVRAGDILQGMLSGSGAASGNGGRGRRAVNFFAMTEAELAAVCVRVDREVPKAKAGAMWKKRVRECAAKDGGLEFVAAALTHVGHAVRQDTPDCGAVITHPARYLNRVTSRFLKGDITKEDL